MMRSCKVAPGSKPQERQAAGMFSWHAHLHEALLHLAQHPVEGVLVEAVLVEDPLDGQGGAQVDLEQHGRVALGLLGQGVWAPYHHQLLQRLPHLP